MLADSGVKGVDTYYPHSKEQSEGVSMQTLKQSSGMEIVDHPAAKALALHNRLNLHPTQIDVLKEKTIDEVVIRSAVYRLVDTTTDGATLVVKKSGRKAVETERQIYQDILPGLPVSSIRCYGVVEDADSRFSWLFLEDAGETLCSPRNDLHCRLAGEWLGLMHSTATDLSITNELVSRDFSYFKNRLRVARKKIEAALGNEALLQSDLRLLEDLIAVFNQLLLRWSQLEAYGSCGRETLVHGDFVTKNICVGSSGQTQRLLPIDWPTASIGCPAIDIGALIFDWQPSRWDCAAEDFPGSLRPCCRTFLETYYKTISGRWPEISFETVIRLAKFGVLMRSVISLDWESEKLRFRWSEKTMSRMRIYARRLASFCQKC